MARVPQGRRAERTAEQQGLGSQGSRQDAPGDIRVPGVQRDPGLSVNPRQFGLDVAEAFEGLGRSVGDLAGVQRELAEQRQGAENGMFLARARSRLNQRLYETQLSAEAETEDGTGFFETVEPRFRQAKDEVLAELRGRFSPSQDALTRYEVLAEEMVGNYGIKAITFQHNARVGAYQRALADEVNELAEGVAVHGDIDGALAALGETLEAGRGIMPANDFADIAQEARQSVSLAYLEGQIRNAPVAVRDAALGFSSNSIIGAIIDQESNGDFTAVGADGEGGAMQVMPDTARQVARELGDRNFPMGGSDEEVRQYLIDASNEGANGIRYGTYYYRKQLRRFGGDTEAALIAYNAGPKHAEAWLKAGRDDSVIPATTRDYYRKVLARTATGGDSGLDLAMRHVTFDAQLKVADKAERASNVELRRIEDRFSSHLANIENFGVGLAGFDVSEARPFLSDGEFAEMREREDQAYQDHEAIRTIRFGPLGAAQTTVIDAAPVPGSPDIETQAARQQRFDKLYRERVEAMQADPAGYAQKGFEDVGEAYDAALSDGATPEDRDRAISLSLEAQEDLGVPPFARRLLPKAVATSIVETVLAQPDDMQPQILGAEMDRWGDEHSWQILSDLREAGLPDLAYIATRFRHQPAIAKRITAGLKVGVDELKKTVGTAQLTELRDALQGEFAGYIHAFETGDITGSTAVRETNALLHAAEVVAMQDIRQGMTPVEAAERVGEMIIDENVTILDGARVTALVPNEWNASLVARGAEVMLNRENVEKMDVEPFGGGARWAEDELPADMVPEGLPPRSWSKERTIRAVMFTGKWVYAGDGKSLTLTVPLTQGAANRRTRDFIMVTDSSGQPITLSYDEAQDMGMRHPIMDPRESGFEPEGPVTGIEVTP